MNVKVKVALALVAGAVIGIGTVALFRAREAEKGIRVSGNIEANEVRVAFRVGGKVKARYVDEGDKLSCGQLLARLDTDELGKIQAQAAAALQAQQAVFDRAKEDYGRAENLLRSGAVSQQARDNARTQMDQAGAVLDNLRANLELADTRLGFAELRSPINGYITVRSAEAGEVVQAGAPIFTAVDLNDIWLTAYVTETELGRVKLGQAVDVTVDSYPGRKYQGTVTFISSQSEFTPKQIQTPEERGYSYINLFLASA
jgi:HlyD family secretion protein